jgi:drug/metabolite transporter (DMT)-like permease
MTGPFFFLPIAGITGELPGIHLLHWKAHLLWALSGIIHFALGRTWAYRSIQLLGSNRSNIVTSLNPIVTIILAMTLLHERITAIQLVGIVLTLLGPLLILVREETSQGAAQMESGSYGKEVNRRALILGVLYGAGAAVFWGSSAIVVKFALQAGGTPVSGTLIAYLAASAAVSPSFLFTAEKRREILHQRGESLKVGVFSGLSAGIGQLLRYMSLQYGSAIAVSMMLRTVSVWVLVFSFLYNREFESFSRWVLFGNSVLVIGTILIIL